MIKLADRLEGIEEYYFSRKLREVRAMLDSGKPVINMGIGSPDLAPPPVVINSLMDAMQDASAHQYQSYQGLPELREAMAEFYAQKFGVKLNPASEILPLMGSKEGILHISMAFLNKGDEVLIPDPGYPTYTSVARLVEAEPRYYDLSESGGWFPDLSALEQTDLGRVKLMWVNYPHMPTGATASQQQLDSLIAFAKKNNILLVNDNPYSFVLGGNPLSLMASEGAREVALELNSLSKTFNMAGWRVGMVLGAKAFIDAILKVKSNMDSGMFYGIQKGAATALRSGENWFGELNGVYKKRRDLIHALADHLGCSYDPQAVGMFVWARLPEGSGDAESYIDSLLQEYNIFVAPGTIFGSKGEGYIRFSLCVSEEKIKEALERVSGNNKL